MNRLLFSAAFLLGGSAIAWVGTGFIGKDNVALAVTAVIALVFLLGITELLPFRRATRGLAQCLGRAPAQDDLTDWLAGLHSSLRGAVRLRIEGEPIGLPAPVFAPYLVGLLVMLGLLGTFVGMVVTLEGAVLALTGSSDLAAVRAGLAAPIEGLGLAFGTSVAGVAASAALGLAAALSRRERILATRQLDAVIASTWREHSLVYKRQTTYRAIQDQADALPDLVSQLSAVGRRLEVLGDSLNTTLVNNQEQFFQTAGKGYEQLADSVDKSLQKGLAQGARLAGEGIAPVLHEALAQLADHATATQRSLAEGMASQVQSVGEQLDRSSERIAETLSETLAEQRIASEALLTARSEAEALWAHEQGERVEQLSQLISNKLDALRTTEAQRGETVLQQQRVFFSELAAQLDTLSAVEASRGEAAVQRLEKLESSVAEQLEKLGSGLEAPISRLLETAAEGPRAAADLLARLRESVSSTLERDNGLLQERRQVMEQLSVLAESLHVNSARQQEAVVELAATSRSVLKDVGESLGERVESQVAKVSTVAADVAGSAIEVASLGDAVGAAVEQFALANDKLVGNLERIEQGLEGASARSNEQMGYYVAQAREIIDQSMLSQREIIDELRRVGTPDLFAAEAG